MRLPLTAGQRNVRKPVDALGLDPFGTGQRRCLSGFAQAVHAVANAADQFRKFSCPAPPPPPRRISAGRIPVVPARNKAHKFARQTSRRDGRNKHTPRNSSMSVSDDNPHRHGRARRRRFGIGRGGTGFCFVAHFYLAGAFVEMRGVNGASYSGASARRLNRYATSSFASGFGTTS